jgi:outer membrane protein OmpA-like peptidoglycan-associated protein
MPTATLAHASARRTAPGMNAPVRAAPSPARPVAQAVRLPSGQGARLQRRCACGGGCASCSSLDPEALLQPRLEVGAVNDPLEHEADRIASAVMAGATPPRATPLRSSLPAAHAAAAAAAPGTTLPDGAALMHGGEPLSASTRGFFESRMGQDLGHVRVHTGAQSQAHNRSVGAQAFAYGSHVWLGSGATPAPNWLMAHELAHVAQQTGAGRALPQRHVLRRVPADCLSASHVQPLPEVPEFAQELQLKQVRESIFERDHLALRRGDEGAAVSLVQQVLLNQVCAGVDRDALYAEWQAEHYGAATAQAVRAWQRSEVDGVGRSLEPDGEVGPLTLGAMDRLLNVPGTVAPARDPEGVGECYGVAEQGPGEAELVPASRVPRVGAFQPNDRVWMLSNFDVAKHFLKTEHRGFLRDNVVPSIKAVPKAGAEVRIIGEASTTASIPFNQALSERRAACARSALIDAGLDASAIKLVTGYGELLTLANRLARNLDPVDGAEDRTARRVSIVLHSGQTGSCSDADKTRFSTQFESSAACESPFSMRIHIADTSDPAKPTWRAFRWTHMPWPPGCDFQVGPKLPIFSTRQDVFTGLARRLAKHDPDNAGSPSDFDGTDRLRNPVVPNTTFPSFLMQGQPPMSYSISLPGTWSSFNCSDKSDGTQGGFYPIGPVKCGEMELPLSACTPPEHREEKDDCPEAYRHTPAQQYNAVLFGVSADISSVLPKWLAPFVPLGGSGAVLGIATTKLPGRQLMRMFVHAGVSLSGSGSGLDRLEAASMPEKDIGHPAQLETGDSGIGATIFGDSDFRLRFNALLTMAGHANKIVVETGEGDFVFNAPHCNHGGERTYHGILRPVGPAFCIDGPLPDLDLPERECKDDEDCPDSTLLAGHRHVRVRVGRATTKSLPPGLRETAQPYGCNLVAAELQMDTDDDHGGPIHREFVLLMRASECGFTVGRGDVEADFWVPRHLAAARPQDLLAPSDFIGGAHLDAGAELTIVAATNVPIQFKLPGTFDATCGGRRAAWGAVLPAGSVDCGTAPEPQHDTRPEADHVQQCEAYRLRTAPMVDRAVANLKSGAYDTLIGALGPAPKILVPPLDYEEWLRTRKPLDVIDPVFFVGRAPGATGDVPVVAFTSMRILAINTDKTMVVQYLIDLCAWNAAGQVVAFKPRGCEDMFIRAGDVHPIDPLNLRGRIPAPAPGPDDPDIHTA